MPARWRSLVVVGAWWVVVVVECLVCASAAPITLVGPMDLATTPGAERAGQVDRVRCYAWGCGGWSGSDAAVVACCVHLSVLVGGLLVRCVWVS